MCLNNVLQETIEKTDANGKLLPEMVCSGPILDCTCYVWVHAYQGSHHRQQSLKHHNKVLH